MYVCYSIVSCGEATHHCAPDHFKARLTGDAVWGDDIDACAEGDRMLHCVSVVTDCFLKLSSSTPSPAGLGSEAGESMKNESEIECHRSRRTAWCEN